MKTQLRVALLGCGTIGSQVAKRIIDQRSLWLKRLGLDITIAGIAVRSAARPRPGIPQELLTEDAEALILSPNIDVVVELLGGRTPAREYIEMALQAKKPVVTANKELLSLAGVELMALARQNSVPLYCEAAVGGAIPLVRVFEEALLGDEILSFKGILNGTTNYILDQMDRFEQTFADALKCAQELGFAEADPTADVEGLDAAAKAAILATEAFFERTQRDQVSCQGITQITDWDVEAAKSFSLTLKLLAKGCKSGDHLCVEVAPTALPQNHPLATVTGATNALYIEARLAGTLMLIGQGAGPDPTASAVLGDVINALLRPQVPSGSGFMRLNRDAKVTTAQAPVPHLVVGSPEMSKMELRDLLCRRGFTPDRLSQGKAPAALTLPANTLELQAALTETSETAGNIHIYRVEE